MITLGPMITGGHSFELGIKDTLVHVARNGYIPRLKRISPKFVLLWDEADKRGWLTNGTSALSHIMLDHQTYVTRRHTGSLEEMPRKDLEGWDFEDLSVNRDSLHPRLVTLEPARIGFGGLIRAAGPALCDYWSHLPRHRYLLAYSISDMEDVVRDHRSSESDHPRLSDNLIWHNVVDISRKCQCGDDAGHHAEPVHVAFPSALFHKLCANKGPIQLSGAAFFGHNPGFSWTWGDTGPPTQQQSKQEIVVSYALDKADKDSGFCLLVGIAGGALSEDNDIRLGDVVVSLPTQTFPGVIQYDLGKENWGGGEFEVTGVLQRPPQILTNAISKIRSDPDSDVDALNPHLSSIVDSLPTYGNPGQEIDVLSHAACTPSGNRVVKDATLRDRLSREYGVLCFEMEAAGVMNRADCLVIRGICDYSDAQKNKIWQNYAAAVAAAYTKLLLGAVAVNNDLGGGNVRTDDSITQMLSRD
ncbi:nucleoside phosphorylase [Fusarium sp. NRRL 25303]|nr:nucleoside phosphorylase [Fusarium sp. NRRL 25303]